MITQYPNRLWELYWHLKCSGIATVGITPFGTYVDADFVFHQYPHGRCLPKSDKSRLAIVMGEDYSVIGLSINRKAKASEAYRDLLSELGELPETLTINLGDGAECFLYTVRMLSYSVFSMSRFRSINGFYVLGNGSNLPVDTKTKFNWPWDERAEVPWDVPELPKAWSDELVVCREDESECSGRDRGSLLLRCAVVPNVGGEMQEMKSEKKIKSGQYLQRLLDDIELFCSPAAQEAFVSVSHERHIENMPVRGKAFSRWVSSKHFDSTGVGISQSAMATFLNTVEGKARHGGGVAQAHVRVAMHSNKIYVDLCRSDWMMVEIDSNGWRLLPGESAPVKFVRPFGLKEMPHPEKGGEIDELRPIVNVTDDIQWQLLVGFMVKAFVPVGAYPIAVVNGEHGSAKTFLTRFVKSLVDPNAAPLRQPPRDVRDLMIAAKNSHLVAYDNQSGLSAEASDNFCRLVSGTGLGVRMLYENDEEVLFEAMRPIIINGIDEFVSRPDLADRSVFLFLSSIPPEKRKTDEELFKAFEAIHGRVLGSLFDAVSSFLARREQVQLGSLPRMADYAVLGTAIEQCMGWSSGSFVRAMDINARRYLTSVIESSAIGGALLEYLSEKGELAGMATFILRVLKQRDGHARRWGDSGKWLSDNLRRLEPDLRRMGIHVERTHQGRGGQKQRHIRIYLVDKEGDAGGDGDAENNS